MLSDTHAQFVLAGLTGLLYNVVQVGQVAWTVPEMACFEAFVTLLVRRVINLLCVYEGSAVRGCQTNVKRLSKGPRFLHLVVRNRLRPKVWKMLWMRHTICLLVEMVKVVDILRQSYSTTRIHVWVLSLMFWGAYNVFTSKLKKRAVWIVLRLLVAHHDASRHLGHWHDWVTYLRAFLWFVRLWPLSYDLNFLLFAILGLKIQNFLLLATH